MNKGRLALAVALIAPFFGVITIGSSAYASNSGGNPKNYSVTVTPTVGAGESADQNNVFSVVVTNLNPLQHLGSLDMSLPGLDFVLPNTGAIVPSTNYAVSPSPTVTVSNGVVEVRGLSMPYQGQASFSVSADVPCVFESGAWTIGAKQANDFSGVPGNSFGLVSDPSVGVSGQCSFSFTQQPADTSINTFISTVPFTAPTNAPLPNPTLVEAQLLDDHGQRVNAGDAFNPGDEAANTTTAVAKLNTADGLALEQVTALAGIASFPSLEVGSANAFSNSGVQSSDVLIATGQANSSINGIPSSALNAGPPSAPFHIWGAGTLCSGNGSQCKASTGANVNSSVTGTATGSGATLEVTQDQEVITCANDTFIHSPAYSTIASTGGFNGALQITITISSPTAAASQYEVCFQDPNYQFFLLGSGNPPQLGPLGAPGLLATCKQTGGAIPCVGSISKNKQGAVVEVVNIPPGDPCVH